MSVNNINVEAFIQDIFVRPPVWDGSFGDKDFFWGEISARHGYLPISALKTKWENLRRSFRNQLKKIPRDVNNLYLIDPHYVQSTWPHYQSMLFLVNRVRVGQQNQIVQFPVKTEERSTVPFSGNVDRKRPNADSVGGSNGTSKMKRLEKAISNIKRSDSDLNDQDAPTKSESATTLNWEDYNDSHLIKDSDRFYLKSLLPYLEKLDAVRKLVVRSKIDEILRDEISSL